MYFEIDDYNALREALYKMCTAMRREKISEETVFGSRLIANELVSNVLQHGGGRAYVRIQREGDEIRICVRGEKAYRPPERSAPAAVEAESGRGLFLVDAYCERRDYSEAEGIRVFLKI